MCTPHTPREGLPPGLTRSVRSTTLTGAAIDRADGNRLRQIGQQQLVHHPSYLRRPFLCGCRLELMHPGHPIGGGSPGLGFFGPQLSEDCVVRGYAIDSGSSRIHCPQRREPTGGDAYSGEGQRVYDIQEVREISRREGWELVARCRAEDQTT